MTEWRIIPDTGGKYQANAQGEVRRIYESGHTRLVKPYFKRNHPRQNRIPFVGFYANGRHYERPLHRVIALTFLGKTPDGMVSYHKNGVLTDNRAENIGFVSRSELGRMTGRMSGGRKAVVKVDRNGKEIEIYPSAKDAAKRNYMSYHAMLNRLGGKVKEPFRWGDFNFRYDK